MIGYTTIGTNDLPRAAQYFDALLSTLGIAQLGDFGARGIAWGTSWNKPCFAVMAPFDGAPATPGNGNMVALVVLKPEQVNAVHAKAIELGSVDEGAPGSRGGGFYGGYFRDLDGNKLCIFCMVAA